MFHVIFQESWCVPLHSLIIIGGGPAGISAAIYAARSGISSLVLHHGASALQRADKIENYFGFEAPISGADLLGNGQAQAERLGATMVDTEVVGISYIGNGYEVKTTGETYAAQAVIIASGSSRSTPSIRGLSSFEGKGVSFCAVCDAFFYRGKHVAVLGNGAYAFEEAQTLLPVAGAVTLLTNGEPLAVDFPNVITIDSRKISEIRGADAVSSVVFSDDSQLALDGIFIAYGTAGSTSLARELGAVLDGNSIRVDAQMQTNLPGLFAAGDCTGGLLQVAKAVSDGAAAGLSAAKYVRAQK